MEKEINRYETLKEYRPCNIPDFDRYIKDFAFYGFYAKLENHQDVLVCYFCNLKCLSLGESEVDPYQLHCVYNRTCPLVRGIQTANIPAPENVNRKFKLICDTTGRQYTSRYPEYENKSLRKTSFKNWPMSSSISVDDLVEVGFFYLGKDDKVACFSCGLGLMDFEESDVPLEEHKQYAKNCPFLKDLLACKL